MKCLTLLLPIPLLANIWVINTEDYLGRVAISKSDYLIIKPTHSLAAHYRVTNKILCSTDECVSKNIHKL